MTTVWMKRWRTTAVTVMGLLALACGPSYAGDVKSMRFWQSPDSTRVVLDLTAPVEHTLFTLTNPDRVVVDIPNAKLAITLEQLEINSTLIESVRSSNNDGTLRVVMDLKRSATPKSFALAPFQDYGDRLVIDLYDSRKVEAAPEPKKSAPDGSRELIIAIDAGHGGEDPGAIGLQGTREKDITLAVARRLADLLHDTPGMKPVLIRNGDYYIDHRKRTSLARERQADLFISFHADAFHDRRVKGGSVWVLSPKGADSEMGRWLERREQHSDMLGGVESLNDKDPLLAQVLLDLSMHYSIGASLEAADTVFQEMARSINMHRKKVERASFLVLKMPDIPSMLVEMTFISNPQEEKLLKSSAHQDKIARAVLRGVKRYFKNNPPDGTLFATAGEPTRHVIRRGDTLSELAVRYQVSLPQLRAANNLRNDVLQVGKELIIPQS